MYLKPVVRNLIAAGLASLCFMTCANAQGLIRDAEIEKYLRDFTDPILVAANLQPEDVNVLIINDPSLNAFVANGQNIHLHTGLIMEAETPGQLIGVIAHETGHIEAGHGVRRIEDIKMASRPAMLSIGLGILAIAAGAGDAGAALIASSQQFGYVNFAMHTRVQEASADLAALRYMEATGRSPAGLLQFFENFRNYQLFSNAERYKFFYTHPLASDRIEALRDGAEKTGLMDVPDPPEDVEKLARIKAKLIGYLSHSQVVNRHYPVSDQSIPALYARAINDLESSFHALALKKTQELISLEPENPFFHELLGQVYFKNNQMDEAVTANRRSLELLPDQPLLQMNLATALISRENEGDIDEAGDLLSWITVVEPDNLSAWYYLSIVRSKQGRIGEADLAIAQQAAAYGDCQRAMIFSRRAQDAIERNQPAYLRASDITKSCAANLVAQKQR